ncbi:pilus assembly protein PilW [Vibrio sp. T187]|uniref:PilW family protein n=1 Tax=Vibrio TaxID=662 RepID=UPI0010C9C596|nr:MULTISPECIES: pilus assembly protein PilW [Vibrio]MBW3697985.1 pilus assembly protein PilW [Vibrio sp. T187]
MTTQNANVSALSSQRGATLVELLVSSALGIFAIGTIGSIFVTGQNVAKDKGLELLLLQNLTSTMQVMKEDIQRAGYDGLNGQSLKLSGSVDTIQLSGSSAIGFVYYLEGSNNNKDFRNIVYRKNGSRLQICEKGTVSAASLLTLSDVTTCHSLLDEKIIQVDEFLTQSSQLSFGGISSTVTDISIQASIPSANLSQTVTIKVKQRNWQ